MHFHAQGYVIVLPMRLADQISQCRTPFIVENAINKRQMRLIGAADFSSAVVACPTRYSLSDDLVGLCTALAYSKGARTLACADLLHVPAERVWIEWCDAPWINELKRYGFQTQSRSVRKPSAGAVPLFNRPRRDGAA